MINNDTHYNLLVSPSRSIEGEVELYNGSTFLHTFGKADALSSFTISRLGAKKFFGYGISQEAEIVLVDKDRLINDIEKNQKVVVQFWANNYSQRIPEMYITEYKRNENTNEITIKANDFLYTLDKYTIADVGLGSSYTFIQLIQSLIVFLGVHIQFLGYSGGTVLDYPEGANFDGTETIREVLDALAEATQSIYYMNTNNNIVFKVLKPEDETVLTISKANYFTLESETDARLSDICNATELGDNITTTSGLGGATQYIRNNPLWELRDDIPILLDEAIARVGGLTINQFTCKWRGNYLLEPGDKLAIEKKDGSFAYTYLLEEKLVYNGGLSSTISWEHEDNESESADNPNTLGGALKKTYAKVDKANKEIEIVAGETAAIKLTTDTIQNSVSQLDNNMVDVIAQVNTKITANDVSYQIQAAMSEGVERITTTTGFTFNEEGLHISKSDSEITTSITEDGMVVYKDSSEVLVADNQGVKAEDLHATTFLIIGGNSRLEDYGSRTGCFWIG